MNGVKIKGTTKMKIKNKLSNEAWSRLRNRGLLVAVGAAALLAAACADDDLANDKPNKHMGTTLAFNVSDVQMDALAQNPTGQTRGLSLQPIPAAYFAPRKIEATGSNPHDFCLIESTVEGLNPVKVDAKTRGTILTTSTLGTFSSIGYRAASSAAASNPSTALLWFHNEKTNPDGTLVSRYDWDWPVNVYGRFYAVSPEATATNGITLSPSNYAQVPYIDFEVKSNVIDQVDLMTACSGEVHYEHGNDPTSNLKFTHALAAVKFSIGSNLSPVIIKKIEVSGVKYKGRYKLPNKADGSDAAWISVDNATTTMTLDGINMNAAEMPNTMLAGALNPATNPNNRPGRQNYTFLMIPQTLPAKGAANHAKVTIYYQEGPTTKHVSFPLCEKDGSGSVWKANTTKEYKLSQKNSSWGYHFTLDGNLTFNYNETAAKPFKVESWREGGTDPVTGLIAKQAIPWKVVKYEEWDYTANGGAGDWIDKGTTKPDWLNNIQTEGNGAAGSAEAANASVRYTHSIDKLVAYNKVLKDATPKGTDSDPYNLANPGGNGARNSIEESANCYLISAPGHYCIPLVYGNGIVSGRSNRSAYHTNNTDQYVLQDFVDHADQAVTKPLINEQNSTDKATKADIVWMDQPRLVHLSSSPIIQHTVTIDGTAKTVDFVKFEVTANDIHNGNAVIAVKNNAGTVMWSWHLWFDHANVLDKIPVKNHDNVIYEFTRANLGQVYIKYDATSYDKPRKTRVTIEQQLGNNHQKNTSSFVIVQNPGVSNRKTAITFYQFGRKDALPSTKTVYDGNSATMTFQTATGLRAIGTVIQHPNTMYYHASGNYDVYNTTYCNLWAANNTKLDNFSNDPVTKTIYDPCPAGFHMPAPKAFAGFTSTGLYTGNPSEFNVVGEYEFYGWNYKTNIGNATIFFTQSGTIYGNSGGKWNLNGGSAAYWQAFPKDKNNAYQFYIATWQMGLQSDSRIHAYPVRPVAETPLNVQPHKTHSEIEAWKNDKSVEIEVGW